MHPGAVIDQRFELERAVTAGGMGQIWRARDRLTGRPVAIKVMLGDDGTAHARFGREAALLADIRHPGVVEYVAHGSYAGAPYLAMEWLDGVDLAARSRATRIDAFATVEMRPTQPGGEGELAGDDDGGVPAGLPAAEVLVLARRLASALGEVHGRGVVHRDLKPENVFLLDADLTRAKLIDFGVARGAEAAALTADGVVIGTPHYMAPEQVRGDVVTAATDVWGLGAVLYELFAGRPPFTGSHPLAVMARIVVDEAPPLRPIWTRTCPARARSWCPSPSRSWKTRPRTVVRSSIGSATTRTLARVVFPTAVAPMNGVARLVYSPGATRAPTRTR